MNKLLAPLGPLSLIFFLLPIGAIAQDQARALSLNSPIERELAAGQRHGYTLNLKPNQIALVIVEQRGVDLVVAVISPAGKKLFEVDSPTGTQGSETATIFAADAGAYRVEVWPLDEKAAPGKYEIRLDKFLTESEYQTERLAALGRLWGAVKFFHPYLAYKNIDWDGALVRAIPQVKTARTPDQYRQAINNLLQALNDPATTAELASIETGGAASRPSKEKEPVYYRVADGFVIVNAIDWATAFVSGNRAAFSKQPQMMQEIGKAKGIVLDCRYGGLSTSELPPFYIELYLDNTLPQLVQGSVPLGTRRYRVHNGYAPQQGNTSGGYSSTFVTEAPRAINGQSQSKKPIAVLVDDKAADLIGVLSGLQAYGAKIVEVGKAGGSAASFYPMQLPDGVRVRVRTTEFVHPNGGSVFKADEQIPDGAVDEKVMSAAIAALTASGNEKSVALGAAAEALAPPSLKDDPYPNMSFPGEEYRLLALFRFWNVINYFYPYKHLIDKPWNTVLTDFIPRFLENKTALDYEITVAEMVARIQDSHGFVGGFKSLAPHLGTHAPPIRLRAVGGKVVVTSLLDQAAADAAGVKIGDVVVAVDGQAVEARIAHLAKFRALSTTQSGYSYIYPAVLRGAPSSRVKLIVESADGQTRELELTRSVPLDTVQYPAPRKTPIYEVLAGGYGYIDLARLPRADAQKAVDAMMNTPAIIFDMRGYPNGTAWEIAPRLTEKKNVTAALFRRPYQSAANLTDEDFAGGAVPDFAFAQKLPPARGAIYRGRVVMLINEDAISQAEHTCMFFEAATDVTFIGTPTNGANGDVTNLALPGGIYVGFSGHDVRHADGRQLQRVGIQPTIRVEPTIAGIRESRDEVLEAAIKFLNSTAKK